MENQQEIRIYTGYGVLNGIMPNKKKSVYPTRIVFAESKESAELKLKLYYDKNNIKVDLIEIFESII